MTPNVALADWLARVGVLARAPLMVSAEELAGVAQYVGYRAEKPRDADENHASPKRCLPWL